MQPIDPITLSDFETRDATAPIFPAYLPYVRPYHLTYNNDQIRHGNIPGEGVYRCQPAAGGGAQRSQFGGPYIAYRLISNVQIRRISPLMEEVYIYHRTSLCNLRWVGHQRWDPNIPPQAPSYDIGALCNLPNKLRGTFKGPSRFRPSGAGPQWAKKIEVAKF